MATAMAPWTAAHTSHGVAPVSSDIAGVRGNLGRRGVRVGRAPRVVLAAARRCLNEDERRGFFAGETRLWTASRIAAGGRRSRRGGRLCVRMAADYYSTLGVPKSATKQDIKSAYRKLARKVIERILSSANA